MDNELLDEAEEQKRKRIAEMSSRMVKISKEMFPDFVRESDAVNHPAHYNSGKFEVIDVIEDWHLGFHSGNVVKYIARAQHKGNELQDLKKARFYLDRLICNLETNKTEKDINCGKNNAENHGCCGSQERS